MLKQYQLGPTDKRVDSTMLFKEVNKSRSGKITLDEFRQYVLFLKYLDETKIPKYERFKSIKII